MTPLEAAIYYAGRGWAVFPCHSVTADGFCTCGNRDTEDHSVGKHPRTLNGVKDATTDQARITEWFSLFPESNIGLACGSVSGVFAVDVDPRHGGFESLEEFEIMRPDGPLPPTLQSVSGGGGRHMIFALSNQDTLKNRVNWLEGVDIRGDGGYIIVPPSKHASGAKYRWLNEDVTIAKAPDDLVTSVDRAKGMGDKSDLPPTAELLKGVPAGKRDDTLFRAACRWRRQLKDRAAVMTLVLEAARNCDPPFPEEQARQKVNQAFRQDHEDDDDEELYFNADDDGRHLTDHGNAQRLVDAYGDELIHVEAWGWMVWTGIRWVADDKKLVVNQTRDMVQSIYDEAVGAPSKEKRKALMRHANLSEAAGRISATVELAKSDPRVSRSVDDFDQEPWLFACKNGTIDLRTGNLLPHSREHMVTRYSQVEYDPSYKFDQWDDFLMYATYDDYELVRYLQMAAGYTLTADTREECLFLIHGPAASGKSTFLDGIQTAMGEYAMVTQAETFLNRRGMAPPKDEIARFYGSRMVATVEVPEGERFAEALVKQLTGGDKVAARHLYKAGFEYTPQFKLWFATNHAPRVQDDAIFRRIRKIPFIRSVPIEERNPSLKMNIRNPETGAKRVLAWAVQGCIDWMNSGGLITPAAVKKETNEYRLDQDKFGAFLDEHCSIGRDLEIHKDALYSRYQAWCFTNGEKPMTATSLTTKLKSRSEGFSSARRKGGLWYTGLTLKEPTPVNFEESYAKFGG
jgi:putative DNA primase/helicase